MGLYPGGPERSAGPRRCRGRIETAPPCRFGLAVRADSLSYLHAWRPPLDHVVGRRALADISHAMQVLRRDEEERPGADRPVLVIAHRLQRSLLEKNDLLLGMPVRLM